MLLVIFRSFSVPDYRQRLVSSTTQLCKREMLPLDQPTQTTPQKHGAFVVSQEAEPDQIMEFSKRFGADYYVQFGSTNLERDARDGSLKMGAMNDRIGRPEQLLFQSVDKQIEHEFDQFEVISFFQTVLYGINYDEFMLNRTQNIIQERLKVETACKGCESLRQMMNEFIQWELGTGAPGIGKSEEGDDVDDDDDELLN
ncbi:Hypothetical_protein [Hexamita inflata]|uniref:Hypothetical_protein n=1 Tax=Hexamita inflata TaxID=28002 RepID=A0AA86NPU3_9EUKA|nr:Hypothetical protein HINF_LOCUS10686 [Hexamita inflata]